MSVETIGVAGLGFLGRSISACLLSHGFTVIAFDRDPDEFVAARHTIAEAHAQFVAHACAPEESCEAWLSRFHRGTKPACFSGCRFVIESITEDPAAKAELFEELESRLAPDAVIATNTSALPITKLQRGRKHPERFAGMHWAEPSYATRFLEIVPGELTSEDTLQRVAALAARLGKEPCVLKRDTPGFIANRLAYAMYLQAVKLIEEGVADGDTIDRAFRNSVGLWASVCGPLRWIDLTGGPALYARAMRPVLPALSGADQLPPLLERLSGEQALGIVNHRGFFSYDAAGAESWQRIYADQVWRVSEIMDETFPLERKSRQG